MVLYFECLLLLLIACEFPLYINEGDCVESCPSSKFGNHETQQCELCKFINTKQAVLLIF